MPRHLHVVCAIIERDGLILAARRKPGLNMAGKWEFPGGKIQDGESPAAALARELREEMGIEVEITNTLAGPTHQYEAFTVTLYPFRCRLIAGADAGTLSSIDHDALAWLPPERLPELEWAEADLAIILTLAKIG